MPITLSALYRYPVKSGRSQSLTHSLIRPQGLPFDREWMVATPDGEYLTARIHPTLLHICASPSEDGLRLQAPGMPDIFTPYSAFQTICQATVWDDQFSAQCGARDLDQWLSTYLNQTVMMLWTGPSLSRRVKRRPAVATRFTDGYPLLIIGEGSLNELNRQAGMDFEMLRFRPNLVIAGAEPFAEDHWQVIQIGEVQIELVKPCERCIITTLDPDTAEKLPKAEPLRTLAKFRRAGDGVIFGQNALAFTEGEIAVGMPIEIIQSNPG